MNQNFIEHVLFHNTANCPGSLTSREGGPGAMMSNVLIKQERKVEVLMSRQKAGVQRRKE